MKKRKGPIPPPGSQSSTDYTLSYDDWELAVFDDAIYFTVITIRGRGTRERAEFPNPKLAFDFEKTKPRSCVYAVTKQGRHAQIDPKNMEFYLERWKILHPPIRSRPVTPRH